VLSVVTQVTQVLKTCE